MSADSGATDEAGWTNVYSSHVDKGRWSPDNGGELSIRWDSGKVSVYSGVPQQLAEQTLRSWSVGKALHAIKQGGYAHRYEGEGKK